MQCQVQLCIDAGGCLVGTQARRICKHGDGSLRSLSARRRKRHDAIADLRRQHTISSQQLIDVGRWQGTKLVKQRLLHNPVDQHKE